jgi:methyl-accepting chemotaxis protein
MSSQAEQLQQTMSFFKLAGASGYRPPAVRMPARQGTGGKGQGRGKPGNRKMAEMSDPDEANFVKF